jgi:hypothetical protein
MLIIFLATKAFKQYHTVEQISALGPPAHKRHWVIEWPDHVINRPVFSVLSKDGPTDKIQSSSHFGIQVKEAFLQTGMGMHVTIHSSR